MDNTNFRFDGCANIYLEGKEALHIVEIEPEQLLTCYVGSPESSIQVQDFRKETALAVQAVMSGAPQFEFADVFNQPAHIKVTSSNEETRIQLLDPETSPGAPTLWLGVLEGDLMPIHLVKWEIIRALDDNRAAFAALIR